MSETHEVKAGESLATIAERYGFGDWRKIFDHPANEKLRSKRPDPTLLPPGDKVFIPDKIQSTEAKSTDQSHTFKVKVDKTEGKVYVRNITVLVHGVNTTNPPWYPLIEGEMAKHQDVIWVDEAKLEHKLRYGVIPFSWGDYRSGKQGGVPHYAVDEVRLMFTKGFVGYDRVYQGHAAVRLKELLDEINALGVQVNAICHSNGTAVISGALMLGASLDNLIFMGSPLDCDNKRTQDEIKRASSHVRGKMTNFWSAGDEWAWIKGGIGAFGSNKVYRQRNPQIHNVKFYRNAVIEGLKITEKETDHSDYMIARHMPIFSSYIKRWAEEAGKPTVEYDEAKIDEFKTLGDWTEVSYYKNKQNVTLESPEMKKYDAEIKAILE